MKRKHLFITASLSILLGLGVVAGIGSSFKNKSTTKVEATSTATHCYNTSDGNFYYLAYWNDSWTSSNAKIWCYFWDNNGHNCWTPTCINTDDNLIEYQSGPNQSYYVVVPSDTSHQWTHGKLHRYDSSSVTSRNTYWNKTADITFGSTFNFAAPYGTSDNGSYNVGKYTPNYFEAGATYYMDLSQGHYDWRAAGHNIYGHLFTGNVSSAAIDVELTQVLGFPNNELYQLVIPDTSDYFRLILHRGTTPSGYTNQTDKLYRNTSNNVFKLNSYTTGTWDWNLSDDDRAGYYGTYFLSQIKCDGAGNITSTSTNWTNVKNEYNRLSKTIQGKVWTSSGAATGTDLVKAMYKYDYIVFYKQYTGYDDFIGREDSSGRSFLRFSPSIFMINSKEASNLIFVVIISIVSVAAVSGYFFLRKKKNK